MIQIEGSAPGTTLSGLTMEQVMDNVASALARRLPEVRGQKLASGRVAIVVSASPSFLEHIDEIRGLREAGGYLITVKGAWRALMERGLTPDALVLADAHPSQIGYIDGLPESIHCYVASQVDPGTFDKLCGRNPVTLYHCRIGEDDAKVMGGGRICIPGAGTGSRALKVATLEGHAPPHAFGLDLCYPSGSTVEPDRLAEGAARMHVYDLQYHLSNVRTAQVDGRFFLSSWSMGLECADIASCFAAGSFPGLVVHGDGMLKAAIAHVARTKAATDAARAVAFAAADNDKDTFAMPVGTVNADDFDFGEPAEERASA